jgi:hypothetical protein
MAAYSELLLRDVEALHASARQRFSDPEDCKLSYGIFMKVVAKTEFKKHIAAGRLHRQRGQPAPA